MVYLLVICSLFFICRKNGENSSNDLNFDFEISKGENFQIELVSNPTTGYSWKWVNRKSDSVVDTIGYEYLPGSPGLVGSGGKEIWKFIGLKIGIDTLYFEYNRVWKPNSTVSTKKIIINVK